MRLRTCLWLFVMLLPSTVFAAEEISVRAQLDRAVITIGDPVEYTVTIGHAPDIEILSDIPYPPSDLFEIKKVNEFRDEEGARKITGKKFTLTAFKVGEYILEPVEVQYRQLGGETQTLQTSRLFLTVKSVTEGEPQQDIRGLKSVAEMMARLGRYLVWILAAVFLGIAAFLVFIRRRKTGETPAPENPLSPEEEAFFNLNALFDSDLLRRGKHREYFFRLSEILRVYIERRHGVLAIESTTFEIDRLLREKDLPSAIRAKIREVLEAADLAKFAKWLPEPQEIAALNKRSREIIEECKPAEKPDGV